MEFMQASYQTVRPMPPYAGNSSFRGGECLLARLRPETRTSLEQLTGRTRTLQRGQRLFIAGETSDSLYLINSGSFKAYINSGDGEEQITDFHFTNDILGFDGLENRPHTHAVQALETSSIRRIPFAALQELGPRDPQLYPQLFRQASRQLNSEQLTIFMLGRMNAEQRLAQFFIRLSSVMQECGRVADRITLSMTRIDIANYLGLALETVCRLLNRFQSAGLLEVKNREIKLLDSARLNNILHAS